MQQEVFDFGRIAAETAADEALVAIERDRLELTQLDIRLMTTQAYFAVKAAHAVLDAATQAQQRSQVHRDFADAAVKSGLRPPIERTRAAADLTRFIVGRIRAEGNLRIARSVFAAAVGYPKVELDVQTGTEPVPAIPPLAQVEQRTLALQPEVLEAHDRQKAQHKQTVALGAKLRPNLYASASISGRAGGAAASNGVMAESRGLLPQIPNYDVGLVLTWPLYEPTVDAAVGASEQREWEYDAAIAAAEQRARTSAQQAYRRTRVAQTAMSALSRAAEAARANYAQAEARFEAGLGTSIELADAEAIRLEAEVQEAVGGFEFATARAHLERVMGG
jgi:outer membrane protein TolC